MQRNSSVDPQLLLLWSGNVMWKSTLFTLMLFFFFCLSFSLSLSFHLYFLYLTLSLFISVILNINIPPSSLPLDYSVHFVVSFSSFTPGMCSVLQRFYSSVFFSTPFFIIRIRRSLLHKVQIDTNTLIIPINSMYIHMYTYTRTCPY